MSPSKSRLIRSTRKPLHGQTVLASFHYGVPSKPSIALVFSLSFPSIREVLSLPPQLSSEGSLEMSSTGTQPAANPKWENSSTALLSMREKSMCLSLIRCFSSSMMITTTSLRWTITQCKKLNAHINASTLGCYYELLVGRCDSFLNISNF